MSSTVYALVLAAGQSTRFGGDKLLAPVRGAPLLTHLLGRLSSMSRTGGPLAGVLVVLPPDARDREALVRGAGLEYIFTPHAGEGVAHSIQSGLVALASRHPDARAALILPGDQPALSESVVTRLLGGWAEGRPVVRPRYRDEPGVPGHPVLLDRSIWTRANELTGDEGFAQLFRSYPELVTTIDVPGHNPTINTPADLARWESSSK